MSTKRSKKSGKSGGAGSGSSTTASTGGFDHIKDLVKNAMKLRGAPAGGPGTGGSRCSVIPRSDIYSAAEIERLQQIFSSVNSNTEIEAAFGIFNEASFIPGIDIDTYTRLRTDLGLAQDVKSIKDTYTIVKSLKTEGAVGEDFMRAIWDVTSETYTHQAKTQHQEHLDNRKYGIRVRTSEERSVDEETAERWGEVWEATISSKTFTKGKSRGLVIATERIRDRRSFTYSSYPYFIVDLTSIQTVKYFADGIVQKDNKTFELEIEIVPSAIIAGDCGWVEFLQFINSISLRVYGVGDISQAVIPAIREKIIGSIHRSLEIQGPSSRLMYGWFVSKPVNLGKKEFLQLPLANPSPQFKGIGGTRVTLKFNGRRVFVWFDDCGIFKLTMSNTPLIVRLCDVVDPQLTGTMLDCEELYVPKPAQLKNGEERWLNGIHAFDILTERGYPTRGMPLGVRLEKIQTVCNILRQTQEGANTNIVPKRFYGGAGEDLLLQVRAALDDMNSFTPSSKKKYFDGLIFQPPGDYYQTSYKWKPIDQLTIDFLLERREGYDDVYEMYALSHSSDKKYERFSPRGKDLVVRTDVENVHDRIVECLWDPSQESFTFYAFRDDRDEPNKIDVAKNVWRDIENPFTAEDLLGETAAVVRSFHNDVKKALITKFDPPGGVIVDIGGGQGGDIDKHLATGVDKVYVIDPSVEQFARFSSRLREKKVRDGMFTLINTGAEDVGEIEYALGNDIDNVKVVYAFFSLTFFYQSEEMIQGLMLTLNMFPEGTKFIGAVLDGRRTKKFLEEHGGKWNEGGWSIVQESDYISGGFGDMISISLEGSFVDQQEPLFYWEDFEEYLRGIGYNPVEYPRFLSPEMSRGEMEYYGITDIRALKTVSKEEFLYADERVIYYSTALRNSEEARRELEERKRLKKSSSRSAKSSRKSSKKGSRKGDPSSERLTDSQLADMIFTPQEEEDRRIKLEKWMRKRDTLRALIDEGDEEVRMGRLGQYEHSLIELEESFQSGNISEDDYISRKNALEKEISICKELVALDEARKEYIARISKPVVHHKGAGVDKKSVQEKIVRDGLVIDGQYLLETLPDDATREDVELTLKRSSRLTFKDLNDVKKAEIEKIPQYEAALAAETNPNRRMTLQSKLEKALSYKPKIRVETERSIREKELDGARHLSSTSALYSSLNRVFVFEKGYTPPRKKKASRKASRKASASHSQDDEDDFSPRRDDDGGDDASDDVYHRDAEEDEDDGMIDEEGGWIDEW